MQDYFWSIVPPEDREFLVKAQTMPSLIQTSGKLFAERTAIDGEAGKTSYTELFDEVAALRGGLYKTFERGERVGVLLKNNANYIKTFLALTTGGFVAAVFPPTLPSAAVTGLCAMLGVKSLVYDEKTAETAKSLTGLNTADVASLVGESAPCAEISGDDDCAIFLTGGTTGRPKGALLSHKALLRGAFSGCCVPCNVLYQRYVVVIPFSHIFGTVRSMLTPLYTGSSIWPVEDSRTVFSVLPAAKPTILILVPALADLFCTVVSMRGIQAAGGELGAIVCGGAPVPESLTRRWDKFGVKLWPGYGLTESANLVSGNAESLERPDSVGRMYPAQEIKFVDGEIWLKGENMMKGYVNNPAENELAFEDGWFKTGDLGRLDEDGYLYITGRKKNIIVLANGENVSPEELEALVYKSPLVKDCLVYEDKSDAGAQIIAVEILPNPQALAEGGHTDARAAISAELERINAELPAYSRMTKLVMREADFERTPSMKIARKQK